MVEESTQILFLNSLYGVMKKWKEKKKKVALENNNLNRLKGMVVNKTFYILKLWDFVFVAH